MATSPAEIAAGPRAARLRLLSCNILAGGQVASYRHYVTQSLKHLLPHRGRRNNLNSLAKLAVDFDLVALQEADAGSLRSGFLNQTEYLAESAGFPFWSHQPNRKMARLAESANGLLSRIEPSEVLDHPLPGRIPGRGALLVRFGANSESLLLVIAHLSLTATARRKQIDFLAELIGAQTHCILMGDLNCETGSAELKRLFERTSLRPPPASLPTFPSWEPRRAIDHILVSQDLTLEAQWTLPHAVSDHLPIAAEVSFPAACGLAC